MSLGQRLIQISNGTNHAAPATSEAAAAHSVTRNSFTPAIDIHEGHEGLILEADLPGATDSSLRVELEHNVLNLHALVERSVPAEAHAIHQETGVTEYFRSFILSDEVEKDQIRAELKNGVLRLTLPRAERAKARRIDVKTT